MKYRFQKGIVPKLKKNAQTIRYSKSAIRHFL